MALIAVTGGSGASGRFILRELAARGHQVRNLDLRRSPDWHGDFRQVKLEDFGQTVAALVGVEGVVHFAADPEPDFDPYTGAQRFHNNTLATFNVFNAAATLGIERVVWASSETVLGFPFDTNRPLRLPVTEDHPVQPQNCYAISKSASEHMARHFARLHGMTILGLRLSNILYESDHRDLYSQIPSYWPDPMSRKFNLWSYIDARDAARAVALACDADIGGTGDERARNYIVSARDTLMNRPNRELVDAVFPGLELDAELGEHDALISSARAGRELGFEAEYSWRDVLSPTDAAGDQAGGRSARGA